MLWLLLACTPETGLKDGIDQGTGPGETGTLPDTGAPIPDAILEGSVEVLLYELDGQGNRIEHSWTGIEEFPFGQIFVAAYKTSAGTVETVGQTIIRTPLIGANPFRMEVELEQEEAIGLYAVLDYAGDAILAQGEPTGLGPEGLSVAPGQNVEGLDILIDAPWDPSLVETGPGSGGGNGMVDLPDPYENTGGDGVILGGSGQAPPGGISLSGALNLESGYAGGRVVVMMFGADGSGPHFTDWVIPQATGGGGAQGNYQMFVDENFGASNLRAALDTNTNGMIDPGDMWGEVADDLGNSRNPVVIGPDDLEGYDILLPMGAPLATIPFLSISGTVSSADEWSGYGAVYVVAGKSRPSPDMPISVIEAAYDYAEFDRTELAAAATQDFTLVLPANTYAYLYAVADEDGDGVVMEQGEAVCFWNNGSAFDSGTQSVTGVGIQILDPPTPN